MRLARAQLLEATNAATHQLRDVIAPAMAVKARDAKEWAGPRAADARAWAAPHVERGLEAAGPRVEAAVEKLTPAVDAARDKIVDELLPRVVEAVHAASVAAAGATAATTVAAETARSRSKDAAAVLRGEAIVKRRKQRSRRRWYVVFVALAAAGGAAFAVLKRQTPQEDPWAVPPGSYPTPSSEPSATGDPLASGDASDALGGTGNSLADPDVPGLTTDSSATAGPVAGTEGGVDPLTSPIEDVEGPNNTGGRA